MATDQYDQNNPITKWEGSFSVVGSTLFGLVGSAGVTFKKLGSSLQLYQLKLFRTR